MRIDYFRERKCPKNLSYAIAVFSMLILSVVPLTTLYASRIPSGLNSLTILALNSDGLQLAVIANIESLDGKILDTGSTPLTFIGSTSTNYKIVMLNNKLDKFSLWENGDQSRTRIITLLQDTTLAAEYQTKARSALTPIAIYAPSSFFNASSTAFPADLPLSLGGCNDLNITPLTSKSYVGKDYPSNAIDNNLKTKWTGDGPSSWITFDMGGLKTICGVNSLWYKNSTGSNYFIISTSSDGVKYTHVYTAKITGPKEQKKYYDLYAINAKFVKITLIKGHAESVLPSIIEVRVIGSIQVSIPAPPPVSVGQPPPGNGISSGSSGSPARGNSSSGGTPPVHYPPTTDAIPPAVMINSPSNGNHIGSSSLLITGTAWSNIGITMVSVAIDNNPYHMARGTTNWAYKIFGMTTGRHSVTAVASDADGNTNSAIIMFEVKTKPNLTILPPANVTIVASGALTPVHLGTPVVSDNVNASPKVSNNATQLAGFPVGNTVINWTATDNKGNSASAVQLVTVKETGLPSVLIRSPVNGSIITLTSGSGVALASAIVVDGTISNSNGKIDTITIDLDHGSYETAAIPDSRDWSNWSAQVPISTVGQHVITAIAYDHAANKYTNSISIVANSSLPVSSSLYDSFSGPTYSLRDGQSSPDGKWNDVFNGHGTSGVNFDAASGHNVFNAQPKTSTSSSETHSVLVLSTKTFRNFELSIDMRTDKQLRQNSPPNTWETAWVMFNFVDQWHHYYFTLKTNGYELGKKDNNKNLDQQVFFRDGNSPKVEIGQWQHVDITMVGNHITVSVNGAQVVDYNDKNMSSAFDSGGSIGLYCEDSAVSYGEVQIKPL